MSVAFRRILFGRPIPTERAHHERLNKIQALAVFASDAISSTAYATQEILLALSVAGAAVLHLTLPVALAIVALLVIVTTSYQQTIFAYPTGGGAYIVSRDNLGELPAQIAGASLLTDYILTVSVSVAAGIAAITSAFPSLQPWTVPLCLVAIGIIAIGNMRGVRESGTIFAIPTYFFIITAYILCGLGFYRIIVHAPAVIVPPHAIFHATEGLSLFLILRAFASGCTALTGVEAISNGIPAFRRPESLNASRTMIAMSTVLGTLFIAITWLSRHYGIVYTEDSTQTVPSMLAGAICGRGTLYLAFQFATMLILIMAANTSFQDFPRLAAIQAADGFLPRPLTNVGERLVFNNGIIALTLFASLLVIVFRGNTDRLIPLYAVGVFLSFTLSQAGMVVRWRRLKSPGWRTKAIINGVGSFTTGAVCLVLATTKFMHGAWMVIVIIPLMVLIFFKIHTHYKVVAKQLRLEGYRPRQGWRHHVLVLAPDIHRGIIPALQYARMLSEDPKAVHVAVDPKRVERLHRRWSQWSRGIPLVVLDSPYRSIVDPIIEYIDRLQREDPMSMVTIIIPEFVPAGFWAQLLHGQTGLMLKVRLLFKRGVVLIDIPYHLDSRVELSPQDSDQIHNDREIAQHGDSGSEGDRHEHVAGSPGRT